MNVLQAESPFVADGGSQGSRGVWLEAIAWGAGLLLILGLFGRIMTFPLNHDEQIHVVAARMIFRVPLYSELGYNHLPGLPLLLGGFYAAMGSDHLLQTGRTLIFLCWMATIIAMSLIARHHTGDRLVMIVAVLALSAGVLLGPPGMLVSNNFLPIPFALWGVHLFMTGLEHEHGRAWRMIAAGAAVGFAVTLKISFVFLVPPVALAALLAPSTLPARARIRQVLLPVLAGGIAGALPVLVTLLTGPIGLYEHTVRYFTGGHLAYWAHSSEPAAIDTAAKLLVAQSVWLSGGGLLAGLLVGVAALLVVQSDEHGLRQWPILLMAGLVVCGAIVSFAPTPAFPQYYEPPVAFLIFAFILLYARLRRDERARMQPVLVMATALSLVIIVPRLVPGLPGITEPSRWTGNAVHEQGRQIRAIVEATPVRGPIATLSPIVALEGDLPIYREFAAGPFVYRIADYLPPADRRWFRTTSPRELSVFLDRQPPSAVIVGREREFDGAFAAYAKSHGYLPVATGDDRTQLFVRPVPLAASPFG